MKYLLALDEGTSSARAIVFDRNGQQMGLGRRDFELFYPESGYVEQDAEEIWQAQLIAAQEALIKAGLKAEDISAIGITNQRETTVLWDRQTGKPVYRAIVWQDRRTAAYCAQLKADGLSEWVQQKTGLVIDPYFSATKIRWVLQNVPEAKALADKGQLAFGTIDSWLLWKLTHGKVHATDVSNASRTLIFNINTLSWDEELLRLFEIPASILPEVRPSAFAYGETDYFHHPLPITGIAGDQQAATFGQACFREGMIKNTYGTGCFILKNIGAKPKLSQNQLITTVAWQVGAQVTYALEGAIFNAGASLQWLEQVGLLENVKQLDALTEQAKDVYFVPAFTGLGAPQWDPTARGLIIGLGRGTTREDILRAGLEAMAYQSAEVLLAMQQDSGVALKALRVDGGVSESATLMQFQADLSNILVERPLTKETTALGAAYLAGLGVGLYSGLEEIEKLWQSSDAFAPDASRIREGSFQRWLEAVKRSMHWEK